MPRKPKPRFPAEFEREDALQEYALTALLCPDASPETIKEYTRERIEKEHHRQKHTGPSLTRDQLVDALGWACYDPTTTGEDEMILSQDVHRAIESACDAYPRAIVLAACELMSIEHASVACRQRKEEVCKRVASARRLLRQLLADYRESSPE